MTPEARLDRLESIAKLFVRAGLRHRRDLRGLSEKIDMLVSAQIKNEELFARNEERFARFEATVEGLSAETDRRFVQLAESQASTDRRLNALIDLFKKGSNGDGSPNN